MKPEVQKALNKEDSQIIDAGINTSFKDIPKEKQESELRAAILYVTVMLGIKNQPDNVTVNFILAFIRNHFKHITMPEFKLAFELNLLAGEENKPQHFHQFNLEFITPVIKNFLIKKRDALMNLQKAVPVEKRLPEHVPTDKEYYETLIQYIEKNKQLPFTWNWLAVFSHMEESGMITETDEELKAFKLKIKQEVKTDATFKKLKAADVIERNQIEDSLKNLSAIYKTEYVKMKLNATATQRR